MDGFMKHAEKVVRSWSEATSAYSSRAVAATAERGLAGLMAAALGFHCLSWPSSAECSESPEAVRIN